MIVTAQDNRIEAHGHLRGPLLCRGAASSLPRAPGSYMKTAKPEHLVRLGPRLGPSEPLFLLTNGARASVMNQREDAGAMGSGSTG